VVNGERPIWAPSDLNDSPLAFIAAIILRLCASRTMAAFDISISSTDQLPNMAKSLVAAGCGNNEVNLTVSGYFLNFAASSDPLVASPAV
jgi:hypothetical protein